jgi:Uma2 family endonuclease
MMSTSVKITVEEFEAMAARGDFDPIEEHNVELIRGEIVPRFGDNPRIHMNPPHADAVIELNEWSHKVAPRAQIRVAVGAAVRIPDLDSEPLPDLAWLVRKDYSKIHPSPEDVCLLIEVCDSSLRKDRGPKLELYAEAGIRDYWIVNIQGRRVDVYRDPAGLIFRDITAYLPGQEIRPLAFPDVSLAVSRLFPE